MYHAKYINILFRNKYISKYLNTNLKEKFGKLLEMLSICLFSTDYNQRPNCSQMLDTINELTVDSNTLLFGENIEDFKQLLNDTNYQFLKLFFEIKSAKFQNE